MWCNWNAMGFFGWTMMIAFWGVIIVLVVWGIRSSNTSGSRTQSNALAILKRRFAAGEIDRHEFEERKGLLEDQTGLPR